MRHKSVSLLRLTPVALALVLAAVGAQDAGATPKYCSPAAGGDARVEVASSANSSATITVDASGGTASATGAHAAANANGGMVDIGAVTTGAATSNVTVGNTIGGNGHACAPYYLPAGKGGDATVIVDSSANSSATIDVDASGGQATANAGILGGHAEANANGGPVAIGPVVTGAATSTVAVGHTRGGSGFFGGDATVQIASSADSSATISVDASGGQATASAPSGQATANANGGPVVIGPVTTGAATSTVSVGNTIGGTGGYYGPGGDATVIVDSSANSSATIAVDASGGHATANAGPSGQATANANGGKVDIGPVATGPATSTVAVGNTQGGNGSSGPGGDATVVVTSSANSSASIDVDSSGGQATATGADAEANANGGPVVIGPVSTGAATSSVTVGDTNGG